MIKQIYIIFIIAFIPITFYGNTLPFVKIYKAMDSSFIFQNFIINTSSDELQNEKSILKDSLEEIGFKDDVNGININLVLSDIELPIKQKNYKNGIYKQGYRLQITSDEIRI